MEILVLIIRIEPSTRPSTKLLPLLLPRICSARIVDRVCVCIALRIIQLNCSRLICMTTLWTCTTLSECNSTWWWSVFKFILLLLLDAIPHERSWVRSCSLRLWADVECSTHDVCRILIAYPLLRSILVTRGNRLIRPRWNIVAIGLGILDCTASW